MRLLPRYAMSARRIRVGIATATAIILLSAGLVVAAIPSSDGVIHGCYSQAGGMLRVIDVDDGAECRQGERPIAWNQTGPPGEPGSDAGLLVAQGIGPTLSNTSGPLPTVTGLGVGTYGLDISGFGSGCPIPQITPVGDNIYLGRMSVICGEPGTVAVTIEIRDVFTHFPVHAEFTYLFIEAAP